MGLLTRWHPARFPTDDAVATGLEARLSAAHLPDRSSGPSHRWFRHKKSTFFRRWTVNWPYREWEPYKAALGMPRRGPWPGQGANAHQPWWGLCEETPQLWASWLVGWWRRRTRQPMPEDPPFTLEHGTTEIPLEGVRLTYSYRWYFRCPCCSRRTEVLYVGRRGVACRRCNRLGYRSQTRRLSEPPWLAAFSWRRRFGRSQCDERSVGELARARAGARG
jgi:hypothetical protein